MEGYTPESIKLDYLTLVQGEEEWLELREQMGATASRFGAAYGVGYISRQKYMRLRRGEEEEDRENPAMAFGSKYEDYVIELYREMVFGENPVLLHRHGFRRYGWDPRLGGSPDRIGYDPATGKRWLIEIKTTTPSKMREQVPMTHMCQMQGLMAIYQLKEAHYVCWGDSHGLFVAVVPFSEEFWTKWLYPALRQFADIWESGDDIPPFKRGEKTERARAIEKLCKSFSI